MEQPGTWLFHRSPVPRRVRLSAECDASLAVNLRKKQRETASHPIFDTAYRAQRSSDNPALSRE
jgi:hypothetical protein